jgi:hypothetical protein
MPVDTVSGPPCPVPPVQNTTVMPQRAVHEGPDRFIYLADRVYGAIWRAWKYYDTPGAQACAPRDLSLFKPPPGLTIFCTSAIVSYFFVRLLALCFTDDFTVSLVHSVLNTLIVFCMCVLTWCVAVPVHYQMRRIWLQPSVVFFACTLYLLLPLPFAAFLCYWASWYILCNDPPLAHVDTTEFEKFHRLSVMLERFGPDHQFSKEAFRAWALSYNLAYFTRYTRKSSQGLSIVTAFCVSLAFIAVLVFIPPVFGIVFLAILLGALALLFCCVVCVAELGTIGTVAMWLARTSGSLLSRGFSWGRSRNTIGSGYTLPPAVNHLISVGLVLVLFWRMRKDYTQLALFLTLIAHSFGATQKIVAIITATAQHLNQRRKGSRARVGETVPLFPHDLDSEVSTPPLSTQPEEGRSSLGPTETGKTGFESFSSLPPLKPADVEMTEYVRKSSVTPIIACFTVMLLLVGTYFAISETELMRLKLTPRLKNLAMNIRDVDTLVSKGYPAFVEIVNSVATRVFGAGIFPAKHAEILAQMHAWQLEAGRYITKPQLAMTSRPDAERLEELVSEGLNIASQLAESNVPGSIFHNHWSLLRCVREASPAARTLLLGGPRIPAVGIMVSGEPGTGKTDLDRTILRMYCHRLGIPYDPVAQIDTLKTSSKFDDTYLAQIMVVIRDVFQASPKTPLGLEQRQKEINFILAAHDSNPFFAEKAEINEKSSRPFVHHMTYMTTNLTPDKFMTSVGDHAISSTAIRRRIPFWLRLTKDRTKLVTAETDFSDLEIWSFETKCWMRMPLETFVDALVLARQSRLAKHSQYNEFASYFSGTAFLPRDVTSNAHTPGALDAQILAQARTNLKAASDEFGVAFQDFTGNLTLGVPNTAPVPPPTPYIPGATATPEVETTGLLAYSRLPVEQTSPNLSPELSSYTQKMLSASDLPRDLPVPIVLRDATSILQQIRLSGHNLDVDEDYLPVREDARYSYWNGWRPTFPAWINMTADRFQVPHSAALKLFAASCVAKETRWAFKLRLSKWTIEEHTPSADSFVKAHPVLTGLMFTAGIFVVGGAIWMLFRPYLEQLTTYEEKYRDDPKKPGHAQTPLQRYIARIREGKKTVNNITTKANVFSTTSVVHDVDENARILARSVLEHNVAFLDIDGRSQYVTFHNGRVGTTQAHLFLENDFAPDALVTLVRVGSGAAYSCLFNQLKLVDLAPVQPVDRLDPETHQVVACASRPGNIGVIFPGDMPPFSRITQQVPLKSVEPVWGSSRVIVPRISAVEDPSATELFQWEFDVLPTTSLRDCPSYKDTSGQQIVVSHYLQASGAMLHGQCGTPVFIANNNVPCKLIGTLEGDSNGILYITTLVRPMLDVMDKAGLVTPPLPLGGDPLPLTPLERKALRLGNHDHPLPVNWELFGATAKPYSSSAYARNWLKPTAFNLWKCDHHAEPWMCRAAGCSTATPALYPPPYLPYFDAELGVYRDPVAESCNKVEPLPITPWSLNGADRAVFFHGLCAKFWPCWIPPPVYGVPPVLDALGATFGFRNPFGKLLVKPLEPNTALGLPYKHQAGYPPEEGDATKGKNRFLRCSVHHNLAHCPSGCEAPRELHPKLHADVNDLFAALAVGPVIFVAERANKVECRLPGKNPRTLIVLSAAVSIVGRMLKAGLWSGCVDNRTRTNSAVGLNPHSLEYDAFVRAHLTKGTTGIASDMADADWRFPSFVHEGILIGEEAAMRAYGDLNDAEFAHWATCNRNYTVSLFMCLLVVGTTVCRVPDFMPTGFILTLFWNTFGHGMTNIAAWALHRVAQNQPVDIQSLDSETKLSQVGDDSLMTLSPTSTYNCHLMAEAKEHLFMQKATTPDKKDVFPLVYSPLLASVDFVRRMPKYDGVHFHAALDMASIYKPLLYARSNDPADMPEIFRSILLELFHHNDPAMYASELARFVKFSLANDVPFSFYSYEELQLRFRTNAIQHLEFCFGFDGSGDCLTPYERKASVLQNDGVDPTSIGGVTTTAANSTVVTEVAPQDPDPSPQTSQDLFGTSFANYPVHAVPDIAKRRIYVGAVAWPTTASANTILQIYNFPYDAVAASAVLQDAFTGWRYLVRATIDIEFTLVDLGTNVGCVMWEWVPAGLFDFSGTANPFRASAGEVGCLQIGAPSKTLRKSIMSPRPKQSIPFMVGAPGSTCIGSLRFWVLNPRVGTQGTTAADDATIEVYASFSVLELDGPDGFSVFPLSPDRQKLAIKAKVAQLSSYERKASNWRQVDPKNNPSYDHLLPDRYKVEPPVPPPKVKKVKNPKPTPPPKPTPSVEAKAKVDSGSVMPVGKVSGDGVLATIGQTLLGVTTVVGNVLTAALPYAETIFGAIGKLVGMAAFSDLPADERPGVPMYLRSRAWGNLSGLSDAVTLHTSPKALVATPLMCAPDVRALMQRPTLISTVSFDQTTTVGTTLIAQYLNPILLRNASVTGSGPYNWSIEWAPLWGYASMYTWAQGTVILAFQFVVAPGLTQTFTFTHLIDDASFLGSTTNYGDLPRFSITISESCVVALIVPLTQAFAWLRIAPIDLQAAPASTDFDAFTGGRIVLTVQTAPVRMNPASTVTGYVNLWAAAGPDLELNGFRGYLSPYSSGSITSYTPLVRHWTKMAMLGRDIRPALLRLLAEKKINKETADKLSTYVRKSGYTITANARPVAPGAAAGSSENLGMVADVTNVLALTRLPAWYGHVTGPFYRNAETFWSDCPFTQALLDNFQFFQGSLEIRLRFIPASSTTVRPFIFLKKIYVDKGGLGSYPTPPSTWWFDGGCEIWDTNERAQYTLSIPSAGPMAFVDTGAGTGYQQWVFCMDTPSWTGVTIDMQVSTGEDTGVNGATWNAPVTFTSTTH